MGAVEILEHVYHLFPIASCVILKMGADIYYVGVDIGSGTLTCKYSLRNNSAEFVRLSFGRGSPFPSSNKSSATGVGTVLVIFSVHSSIMFLIYYTISI